MIWKHLLTAEDLKDYFGDLSSRHLTAAAIHRGDLHCWVFMFCNEIEERETRVSDEFWSHSVLGKHTIKQHPLLM